MFSPKCIKYEYCGKPWKTKEDTEKQKDVMHASDRVWVKKVSEFNLNGQIRGVQKVRGWKLYTKAHECRKQAIL